MRRFEGRSERDKATEKYVSFISLCFDKLFTIQEFSHPFNAQNKVGNFGIQQPKNIYSSTEVLSWILTIYFLYCQHLRLVFQEWEPGMRVQDQSQEERMVEWGTGDSAPPGHCQWCGQVEDEKTTTTWASSPVQTKHWQASLACAAIQSRIIYIGWKK